MTDFEYVARSVPGPGCDRSWFEDQLEGCSCEVECSTASSCGCLLGAEDNYNDEGLLMNKPSGAPIIECHFDCNCSSKCRNRKLQQGIQVKLKVYLHSVGKGYAVKALESIRKGRFVCEYASEVIGKEEVERRAQQNKFHNYTLTLKETTTNGTNSIFYDPRHRGNLGRFINHSCDPNLEPLPIRVGRLVPVIGFFARRDILPEEELTYDYGKSTASEDVPRKPCCCGASNCRLFLPASATATE